MSKKKPKEIVTTQILIQLPFTLLRKLLKYIDVWVALYNETNFTLRRFYYKNPEKFLTDENYRRKTYKKVYYLYYILDKKGYKKLIGSASVQRIIRARVNDWENFVREMNDYKENPDKYSGEPKPPGYRKYYKGEKKGKRILRGVFLRHDQFKIHPDKHLIELFSTGSILKRVKLQYKGKIIYDGEYGEIVLYYDTFKKKIYARVQIKNPTRRWNGKEWVKYPLEPTGEKIAGIDIGINNLLSTYIYNPGGDDTGLVISGRPLKALSYYFQKLISKCQKIYDLKKNNKLIKVYESGKHVIKYVGDEELDMSYDELERLFDQCNLRRIKKLHRMWTIQYYQFIDTMVNQLVKYLWRTGVKEIVVGDPKYLNETIPDKNKTMRFLLSRNFPYNYIITRIINVTRRYGIIVHVVDEAYTSRTDPDLPEGEFKLLVKILKGREGVGKKYPPKVSRDFLGKRFKGRFVSSRSSREYNSDMVGAGNILRMFLYELTDEVISLDPRVLNLSIGNVGRVIVKNYPYPGSRVSGGRVIGV